MSPTGGSRPPSPSSPGRGAPRRRRTRRYGRRRTAAGDDRGPRPGPPDPAAGPRGGGRRVPSAVRFVRAADPGTAAPCPRPPGTWTPARVAGGAPTAVDGDATRPDYGAGGVPRSGPSSVTVPPEVMTGDGGTAGADRSRTDDSPETPDPDGEDDNGHGRDRGVAGKSPGAAGTARTGVRPPAARAGGAAPAEPGSGSDGRRASSGRDGPRPPGPSRGRSPGVRVRAEDPTGDEARRAGTGNGPRKRPRGGAGPSRDGPGDAAWRARGGENKRRRSDGGAARRPSGRSPGRPGGAADVGASGPPAGRAGGGRSGDGVPGDGPGGRTGRAAGGSPPRSRSRPSGPSSRSRRSKSKLPSSSAATGSDNRRGDGRQSPSRSRTSAARSSSRYKTSDLPSSTATAGPDGPRVDGAARRPASSGGRPPSPFRASGTPEAAADGGGADGDAGTVRDELEFDPGDEIGGGRLGGGRPRRRTDRAKDVPPVRPRAGRDPRRSGRPDRKEDSRDDENKEVYPGDAGGGEFDVDRSYDGVRDGVGEEEDGRREVLADRSNAIDRPTRSPGPDRRKANVAHPRLRTRSARKKKRGSDAVVPPGDGSGPVKKRRTAVTFSVPATSAAEGGNGGRHFCLVEGLDGSAREGGAGAAAAPRRGRLLELPGGAAPGRWDAVLLPAGGGPDGSPPSSAAADDFRISLRHESAASMGPLEAEDGGKDGGVYISAVRPAIHRASHFERQGVITPEEADGGAAPRLGCIALAAFAGCACSSSVLRSGKTAGDILGRCEPAFVAGGGVGGDRLLGILGDDEGGGVLWPCRPAFDGEYTVLLCHDGGQNVVGIDVVPGRPPLCREPRLTEANLLVHQDRVGTVSLIERLFVERQVCRLPEEGPAGSEPGNDGSDRDGNKSEEGPRSEQSVGAPGGDDPCVGDGPPEEERGEDEDVDFTQRNITENVQPSHHERVENGHGRQHTRPSGVGVDNDDDRHDVEEIVSPKRESEREARVGSAGREPRTIFVNERTYPELLKERRRSSTRTVLVAEDDLLDSTLSRPKKAGPRTKVVRASARSAVRRTGRQSTWSAGPPSRVATSVSSGRASPAESSGEPTAKRLSFSSNREANKHEQKKSIVRPTEKKVPPNTNTTRPSKKNATKKRLSFADDAILSSPKPPHLNVDGDDGLVRQPRAPHSEPSRKTGRIASKDHSKKPSHRAGSLPNPRRRKGPIVVTSEGLSRRRSIKPATVVINDVESDFDADIPVIPYASVPTSRKLSNRELIEKIAREGRITLGSRRPNLCPRSSAHRAPVPELYEPIASDDDVDYHSAHFDADTPPFARYGGDERQVPQEVDVDAYSHRVSSDASDLSLDGMISQPTRQPVFDCFYGQVDVSSDVDSLYSISSRPLFDVYAGVTADDDSLSNLSFGDLEEYTTDSDGCFHGYYFGFEGGEERPNLAPVVEAKAKTRARKVYRNGSSLVLVLFMAWIAQAF